MSKANNQEKTVEFENSDKPFSIELGGGLSFEVWIRCDLHLMFDYTEAVAGTYEDPPEDAVIEIQWKDTEFTVGNLEAKLVSAAGHTACDVCDGDSEDVQVKRFLNFWVDGISAEGDHKVEKYLLDEIEQQFDLETLEDALEGTDVVQDAKEAALGI
jgi:hypothetical protein